MFKRNLLSVPIASVFFLGVLLFGQICAAQSDPCNPDPCQGIQDAVPGTCTPAGGGSCAPPTDFFCSCYQWYAWQDATNTCEGGPCIDNDADGYGSPVSVYCTYPEQDCDDGNADVYPGAPELCDGLDNDCDGQIPPAEADADADGWRVCAGDCYDLSSDAHPQTEGPFWSVDRGDGSFDYDCDSEETKHYTAVNGSVCQGLPQSACEATPAGWGDSPVPECGVEQIYVECGWAGFPVNSCLNIPSWVRQSCR